MNISKQMKTDIIVFVTLFILYTLVYILIPQFPDFDFANYKTYHYWSIFNPRFDLDFYAGNFGSYYNPVINIPTGLIIYKLNNLPILFFALSVLDNVFCAFLIYKITNFIFDKETYKFKIFLNVFIVIYSLSSPFGVYMLSFDRNDPTYGIFCLLGLYFFLKHILNSTEKIELKAFISGCLFGLAAGIKLCALVYCSAMFLIYLCLYKKFKNPIKLITLYSLGALICILLLNGHWMYNLYKYYQNPLFPFYNQIFKSPYFATIDLRIINSEHIRATNLTELIFYLFKRSDEAKTYGFNSLDYDFRFPIAYITLLILSVFCLFKAIRNHLRDNAPAYLISIEQLFAVLVFTILPVFINTALFGDYRYVFSSIYLFAPLLCYLIYIISAGPAKKIITAILLCILLLTAVCFSRFRIDHVWDDYKAEIKDVYKSPIISYNKDINFDDNSYVILLNALTALIFEPTLNKNVHYLGYALPEKYWDEYGRCSADLVIYSKYLEKTVEQLILSDKKIYIVYSHDMSPSVFFKSIEEINGKRAVKRTVKDIGNLDFKFLGKNYFNTQVLEYN